ncbi:MAG: 30S ribosomal protein S16 [Candidatus Omnitrophota bacterium]
MAVKIRLKRFGTTNRNQWRVVVSDVKMPRDGRFIEEIGYYDPIPAAEKIHIKNERLEYWLKQGAKPSPTVANLLKRLKKKQKAAAAK